MKPNEIIVGSIYEVNLGRKFKNSIAIAKVTEVKENEVTIKCNKILKLNVPKEHINAICRFNILVDANQIIKEVSEND